MVDFSCVGGLWIKKQVAVQVSVGVVDLGHEGGWWIELRRMANLSSVLGWWISEHYFLDNNNSNRNNV